MTARPRVLYVTPIFGYPPLGGPRLRTYYTLRAIAAHAEVSLYVTAQPDTPDREQARQHLLSFCEEVVFPPEPRLPGGPRALVRALLPAAVRARLRALRSAAAEPEQRSMAEVPWRVGPPSDVPEIAPLREALLRELGAWIAAHRPHLIWLGFGGISYDLVPLRQLTGTPLVLETECVWSRFILRELPFVHDPQQRQRILREGRAKEAEERAGAALVDLTTAVSEVDAAYFRELAPDPARVMLLHNVIDTDAYAAGEAINLQQPALVFAGSLSNGTANVDAVAWLLDEVMPRVWQRQPTAHVYLVGRDPAPAVVARRGQRVHVTGEVPSIVPYLRASRAALVPLRWESGTRFKILEAFACQTPVVSTTLGAEGLAVEHGQHLLLADAPDAFAAAILSLLEDPTLGQRLVGPAYELLRQMYDVRSAERQVAAILAQLRLLDRAAAPA
jgi:glycosyltransferase involved in cell wall biosynthesis